MDQGVGLRGCKPHPLASFILFFNKAHPKRLLQERYVKNEKKKKKTTVVTFAPLDRALKLSEEILTGVHTP